MKTIKCEDFYFEKKNVSPLDFDLIVRTCFLYESCPVAVVTSSS